MNVLSTLLADVVYVGDQRGMIMSIITWLFIGLVAGFVASKVVNKRGEGLVMDIVLGIVGAFVGGFLFSLLGIHAGGLFGSIVIATLGAIVILVIYHMLVRA